ncbi:MAG: hypothetical protein HDT33_02600 [Clostridiales bacterium]|nr:hypothetical protein [Clostridiales bacterium]
MFNLLRMDLRRLFKTRSFYIVLAVTVGFLVLMVLMIAAITSPEVVDSMKNSDSQLIIVETDQDSQEMREEISAMTRLDFIYECLGSDFLLVMAGIGVTLFVLTDFSSGFIKNICSARPRRREYVLSKVLTAGIYSGILVAAAILTSAVCPILFGLQLGNSPITRILQYAFWLWLPCWAFGLLGLGLVLLTRSSTLGIIMAILSGGGVMAVLLQSLCQRFGWPDVSQYMLSMVASYQCVPMLGAEQMVMILACTAG